MAVMEPSLGDDAMMGLRNRPAHKQYCLSLNLQYLDGVTPPSG